jgi:hypothetical protein
MILQAQDFLRPFVAIGGLIGFAILFYVIERDHSTSSIT